MAAPVDTLPGIDLAAALARLGGDRGALAALLRRFGRAQGDTADEVRALLADGLPGRAGQALHRLRGVAANLGATDAARLCATAEAALHDGDDAALAAALARLATALAVVVDSAEILSAQEQSIPTSNTDAQLLPQKLAELQSLLQNNNLKALEHFRALRPALAATAPTQALADAVETLDFGAACTLVETMLQRKDSA